MKRISIILSIILLFVTGTTISQHYNDSNYLLMTNDGQTKTILASDFEKRFPYTHPKIKNIITIPTKKTLSMKSKSFFKTSTINIPVKFYDRGSEKLIVLGPGCPGNLLKHEYLAQYIFENFDVLDFRYRWQKADVDINMKEIVTSIMKKNWTIRPSKIFYNLFEIEHNEIITVVNHFKKQKKYSEVVGLSVSYSSYPFLKAQITSQEQDEPLFTKLILNAFWLSLRVMAKNMFIPNKPENSLLAKFFKSLIPKRITTEPLLKKLQCKQVMVVHGKNDPTISYQTFKDVWKNINNNISKTALVIPDGHLIDFSKMKTVCNLFINTNNHSEFEKKLLEV